MIGVPSFLRLLSILLLISAASCSGGQPGAVTRADFEAKRLTWPLTVPSGVVGCEPPGRIRIEVDGIRYGPQRVGHPKPWLQRPPPELVDTKSMDEMRRLFPNKSPMVTYIDTWD